MSASSAAYSSASTIAVAYAVSFIILKYENENMTKSSTPSVAGRRLGRPARVTKAQIAEAALSIGLHRSTIRNVAEALGISVPGLYHHVRLRQDLLNIAAAHCLQQHPAPTADGANWQEWLTLYARHLFDTLVTHPEIITMIVSGPSYLSSRGEYLERILQGLEHRGFSLVEAYEAYVHVNSAVIGAAAFEARRRASIAAGRPAEDELESAVAELGDALPGLRQLMKDGVEPPSFESTLRVMLDGIAMRRGQRS
jgi:AcrR family transcriptional regulator